MERRICKNEVETVIIDNIKEQAPFVAKQDAEHFGFLNIDINGKTLKGTFYANESELPHYYYVDYQNNIIDQFTISKTNESSNVFKNLDQKKGFSWSQEPYQV